MIRLFIGIRPKNEAIKKFDELANKHEKEVITHWLAQDNIHVTLQFLGWVKQEDVVEILENVEKAVEKVLPFTISYASLGLFPEKGTPRIVWAGIGKGADELMKLKTALNKVNRRFIKKKEKAFVPHLTLARLKNGKRKLIAGILEEYKNIEFHEELVDNVVLFKSTLSRRGSIYSIVRTFRLK